MSRDRCKVARSMGGRIARRARKLTARCHQGVLACPMSAREQLGHAETDGKAAADFARIGDCVHSERLVRRARDAYEKASKSISQSKAVKTRRIVSL